MMPYSLYYLNVIGLFIFYFESILTVIFILSVQHYFVLFIWHYHIFLF